MEKLSLCISRKVKKSESKSQLNVVVKLKNESCVYPVKLKNLKANHNVTSTVLDILMVVYIP